MIYFALFEFYYLGAGSEELAFALCTSDRMGLLMDLYKTLYGDKPQMPVARSSDENGQNVDSMVGGNVNPVRIAELTAQGYPVRNHITQKVTFCLLFLSTNHIYTFVS